MSSFVYISCQGMHLNYLIRPVETYVIKNS